MGGAAAFGAAAATIGLACSAAERHWEPTNTSSACTANVARANLDFAMKDIAGRAVKLADYKGKVLLLDFWGPDCVPCIHAIPHLNGWQQRLGGSGLEVIGIAYDFNETSRSPQEFVEKVKPVT